MIGQGSVRDGLDNCEEVVAAMLQLKQQSLLSVLCPFSLQVVCGLSCQQIHKVQGAFCRTMRPVEVSGDHPQKISGAANQRRGHNGVNILIEQYFL
jgi:hypothetical protein